jgi:hypothetical protein
MAEIKENLSYLQVSQKHRSRTQNNIIIQSYQILMLAVLNFEECYIWCIYD